MTVYLVRNGAPTVMVSRTRTGVRHASYCLDHAMVFEARELVEHDDSEFRFDSGSRTYFFARQDVQVIR
jgi:hypothetical protein